MANGFARYHGGISFSLAISLSFLTLIVHQRQKLRPVQEAAAVAKPVVELMPLVATKSHSTQPQTSSSYADQWRAMASEYYAKHPPLDASSVQLVSHQQATSRPQASVVVIEGAHETILPASSFQTLMSLGIGGLFAALSSAGIGFIAFQAAWPTPSRARAAASSVGRETSSMRVSHAEVPTDERVICMELPASWLHVPRSNSDRTRIAMIAVSYAAMFGAFTWLVQH